MYMLQRSAKYWPWYQPYISKTTGVHQYRINKRSQSAEIIVLFLFGPCHPWFWCQILRADGMRVTARILIGFTQNVIKYNVNMTPVVNSLRNITSDIQQQWESQCNPFKHIQSSNTVFPSKTFKCQRFWITFCFLSPEILIWHADVPM